MFYKAGGNILRTKAKTENICQTIPSIFRTFENFSRDRLGDLLYPSFVGSNAVEMNCNSGFF